jgi:integrase
LLYVHEYTDIRGKPRRYFRRPGYPRVALPGLPGSKEFREAYEAALSGIEKKPVGIERTVPGSISAAIVSYFKSAKFSSLADETRRTQRNILERFRSEWGQHPISALRPKDVQAFVDKKANTPAGAMNFLKTLRALIKHCVKTGLRTTDPTMGVTSAPLKGDGYHTWTEEEIKQFEIKHPIGTRQRLALALLLYTAQRRSDVVRMGPADVKNGTIRVKQKKTGTTLSIPMHPELVEVIAGTKTVGKDTFLVTLYGEKFTPAGFTNWFRDQVNAAELKVGISAHGLRKAACRRLAEAGCTEQQIMAISGHKNSREVQTYVRAADQERMARMAMDTVTAAFPTKNGTPGG